MKNAFVILLAVFPLGAQQPTVPPPVLRIFREDIKEGKAAAHEKTEAAFMQAAARAHYPAHILGLTSITGTSLAMFLEGHESFASIADSQAVMDRPEFGSIDAADAEVRINQRSMLAVYRPDLSYRVDKGSLSKMRFFSVDTIRIREGQGQAFAELAKMLVAGAEKSGDTQLVATYEVVSGAPNGTYLLTEPTESLKSMDEGQQRRQALFQALGESGMKQYAKAVADTIASEESILFAVNPAMSYEPKEWADTDPNFWGHKSANTTKSPTKPSEKTASK